MTLCFVKKPEKKTLTPEVQIRAIFIYAGKKHVTMQNEIALCIQRKSAALVPFIFRGITALALFLVQCNFVVVRIFEDVIELIVPSTIIIDDQSHPRPGRTSQWVDAFTCNKAENSLGNIPVFECSQSFAFTAVNTRTTAKMYNVPIIIISQALELDSLVVVRITVHERQECIVIRVISSTLRVNTLPIRHVHPPATINKLND